MSVWSGLEAALRAARIPACTLLVVLSACTDGIRLTDPLADGMTRTVEFALATSFGPAATARVSGEISRARITVTNVDTGAVLDVLTVELDPNADEWSLDLEIEIELQKDFEVILLIELLSLVEGVEQVEWSGETPAIRVQPGSQPTEVQKVEMVRGPPANLGVRSVHIDGAPDALYVGDEGQLTTRVEGGGEGATVFFTSLDPTLAVVSPGGLVTALSPGDARIVAEAGPRADTATVRVQAFPLPPDEELAQTSAAVSDIGSRLVSGLQDGDAVGRISTLMQEVESAIQDREGARIMDAIDGVRTLLAQYGGGSEDLRRQDGPALSLIELTLDYISSIVESER